MKVKGKRLSRINDAIEEFCETQTMNCKQPAHSFRADFLATRLMLALFFLFLFSCNKPTNPISVDATPNPFAQEKQLTRGPQGHFLNHRQAFSHDDEWLAFDGRTDDPKMGENDLIGMVNVNTGEVKELYRVPGQQSYGPGSGAVSFSPSRMEAVFIRGLLSANAEHPYHFTRRSAMGIDLHDLNHPKVSHSDARDISGPFTAGALRGGSHAYSYTDDGNWISYTYNDEVLEKTALINPEVKDIRTVAFMVRGEKVEVKAEFEGEEFSGTHFSVIAAQVVPFPKAGSDQIQKAYEETWVGANGYIKSNGDRVYRAMAYLGDVVGEDGRVVTEIFVTDIPQNWEQSLSDTDLVGSEINMPQMPKAFKQRRITYTSVKTFPGVQGPRHWLKASQDGTKIFFYAKDDDGIVQLFSVSPEGGELTQITRNNFSPDTAFSLSPDGRWIVFGYQNRIYLTDLATGETTRIGQDPSLTHSDLCNFNWSYSGQRLVYNRRVVEDGASFFQIFVLDPFAQ